MADPHFKFLILSLLHASGLSSLGSSIPKLKLISFPSQLVLVASLRVFSWSYEKLLICIPSLR
ncbi:hypothetical protein TorRG33x02_246000 [Trema orientale]|uniref:LRR domain containing protein n=1 Tax=Trema orientale TaxID=63057 RepID=A0A2P5DNH4_TREOI|nr:hypothetical protein TorRG33x02_246000 [Trema orientale]